MTDLLRKLNVSLNSKLKRERDPRRTKSIQKLEATISEYQRQLDELIGVQSPDKPADSDLKSLEEEVENVIKELSDEQQGPLAGNLIKVSPQRSSDDSHYETVSENESSVSEDSGEESFVRSLIDSNFFETSSESDDDTMGEPSTAANNSNQGPNQGPNPGPNQGPNQGPNTGPNQGPNPGPAPNPGPNPLLGPGAPTFDQWKDYADANTTALIEGMTNLNAVAFKQEIPEFTGELNDGVTIDEWLKSANKVALAAGWNDAQKLRYFQDRMTKSAGNFNETLTANQKATFKAWERAIVNGFQDSAVKMMRKAQLKSLRQNQNERVRDFKRRIDDTYKVAYGDAVTNSAAPEVVSLRNEVKKEVLLNGIKSEISSIIWGRLRPNADFESCVQTAIECEQIIEIRRAAEAKTSIPVAPTILKKKTQQEEIDELRELVHQLAREKLTSRNNAGQPENTVAFVGNSGENPGKENPQGIGYQRSRSQSPGPRRYNNPTTDRQPSSNQVRFSDNPRQGRSPSPGFRQGGYRQDRPYNSYLQRQAKSENPQQPNPWNKETRTCFFCRKRGHIKAQCRRFAVWKSQEAQRREESRSQNHTQA